MTNFISQEDIAFLKTNKSADGRSKVAEKILHGYNDGSFAENQNKLAEDIIRILVNDTEIMIRQLVAEHLKHNPKAPYDVVMALANDSDPVSVPILQHSQVMTTEDLISIVKYGRNEEKAMAISKRKFIPEKLSNALIDTKFGNVVESLLQNTTSIIGENSLLAVIERYSGYESVMNAMIKRAHLPAKVAEQVLCFVSDSVKQELIEKYNLSSHLADEAASQVLEIATLDIFSPQSRVQPVEDIIKTLYEEGRLSASIVIRALCSGDIEFFEAAVAKRAGIPLTNAKILIHDRSLRGFSALYRKAELPASTYRAVETMLKVVTRHIDIRHIPYGARKQRIIEHIFTEGYDRSVENMSYLLTVIGSDLKNFG